MKTTKAIAFQALNPIATHVQNKRGALKEVTDRLGGRLDMQFTRQQVSEWVTPDPKKFTEPKLGVGLALMEIGNKMIEGEKAPKNRKKKTEKKPST